MSSIPDFLGEVAGTVVADLVADGHTGIRLQDTTSFSFDTFLASLPKDEAIHVVIAGITSGDLKVICKKHKFPESHATRDLSKGTEWRNNPKIDAPIVLVAFDEEERLGSFHRFVAVQDHDLYRKICERAIKELCPNQVLRDWWEVLKRQENQRQTSVQRLAAYFLALAAQNKRLPEASRENLHHLGLLPSREFFDHASPAQIARNVRSNRQLCQRIELLSNADRDRLTKGLETVPEDELAFFQRTLGAVLAFHRTGADKERSHLFLEDVRRLFEARKNPGKDRSRRSLPAETAAVSAVLDDEPEEVQAIGEQLREKLKNIHEEESPRVTLELPTRSEQVTIIVPQPLVVLVQQSVSEDHLGGVFRMEAEEELTGALANLAKATFEPFLMKGDQSFDGILRRVVDTNALEPEILKTWERLVGARKTLTADAVALAVSPLVALTSDDGLLTAGHDYLEAYQDLLASLRDRYEHLAKRFAKGTRRFCAKLLLHETILIKTKGNVHAVLSPLHPLHLWKFVRLAEQIKEQRKTLTPEFKTLLAEQAEQLPHFVTAIFVPEGFVSEHPLVLPETGHLGTLPSYQQEHPHFAGPEGQDRIRKILYKFIALYPHAKANLRLCIINPPSLSDLLDDLSRAVVGGELPVEAMEVHVFRTLPRSLSLGLDDQQLEAIAEVFAEEHEQAFHLVLHQELTTYADILAFLEHHPVHIVAAFDPSRSQAGQFTGHATGFIHPLVLPKEFQYDPLEDQLTITPAATGDIFDLFLHLQNRLNNALTGSLFGISTTLSHDFPASKDFLKCATWLVLGDRLLDTQPLAGGQMICFEPGVRRDIIVLTENFTKFEREFDYHLRSKLNLDPTEEAIRDLIVASADLVGEGLLGLVRPDGE